MATKQLAMTLSSVSTDIEQTLAANDPAACQRKRVPRTAAEFFAGIGLMRMGLERGGWQVRYANDIDDLKREMYVANFGEADFVLGDIHKAAPETVPTVSLATASFPCTDLSLAGARAGLEGEQSGAFWGFVSILAGMGSRRPPIVLLENVTAFMTSTGGKDFHRALLALNGLGYSVDAFIMDAAWFVPQSRKRLFVVGVQGPGDYANPLVNAIRPRSLVEFIIHHPDIAWNIRSMRLPSGAVDSLEQVLEELPEDSSEWWGPERSLYLLNQMSDRHRTIADQMIAGEAWRYGTVFRRTRSGFSTAELRTDGRAGCLRTPKGGSAKQIVIKAGFGECHVRHLTPRECARLMAADDYLITVPRDQALFGFGDAVCVSAVEWITKHYLNPVLAEIVK